VSTVFAVPPWQLTCEGGAAPASGGRQGRGVPDVAANADPQTGYAVSVDGTGQVLGGTSAAAPLWAALVAMANQHSGTTAGLLTPLLYAGTGGGALRDVTRGRNGAYRARPGWDPCTGLGTPDGERLLRLLSGG
jgi:kumamolisin